MKKANRLTTIIAVMLALLFCQLTLAVDGGIGGKAYAATTVYSGVLEDLRKDENFQITEYPADKTNYSLDVIQLAESDDGELFLYVYQPCGEVKTLYATTVRLSTVAGENKQYTDYKLTLLNANGVFYKYLVNGLEVSQDKVKYYDIPAIHRKWDSAIDKPASGVGSTVNEVAYEVAQLWEVRTENGEVTYAMQKTEVITITDKRVGKLRYTDGFYLYGKESCDSHYVAFSTDKQIDTLYEADIEYMSQYTYRKGYEVFGTHTVIITEDKSEAEPHKEFKTLTYTDKASNDGNGLFGHKYTWKRIESVADFIKNEDLTDEAKADLRDKQWVLRFTETAFNFSNLSSNHLREYTEISEVTILRLKFETSGKVYNLGVVDGKQTGSNLPDNPPDITIPIFGGNSGCNSGCGCADVNWWLIVVSVVVLLIIVMLIRWVVRLCRRRQEEKEEETAKAKKPKKKKRAGKKK